MGRAGLARQDKMGCFFGPGPWGGGPAGRRASPPSFS